MFFDDDFIEDDSYFSAPHPSKPAR